MEIKVPRLKPGQYIKGPESAGCFNTGMATIIWRCRVYPNCYLVGNENFVLEDVRRKMMFGKYNKSPNSSKYKGRRIYRAKDCNARAFIYQARTSAVNKFRELVTAQIEENRKTVERVRELHRRANKGDMKAALDLMDY